MKTGRNKTRIVRVLLVLVLIITIFSYVLFIEAPEKSRSLDKNISNFKLSIQGVIIDKISIGHNDARCELLVLNSNLDKFQGFDYLGREIDMLNDTVNLTLMRSDCLSIGDTILFGPGDNYIIRNKVLYLDRLNKLDDCYELGRR